MVFDDFIDHAPKYTNNKLGVQTMQLSEFSKPCLLYSLSLPVYSTQGILRFESPNLRRKAESACL